MKKFVFIFALTALSMLFASAQVGIVNNDTTIYQGQEVNLSLSGINVTYDTTKIDQFIIGYRDGAFSRSIPTVVGQDYFFTVKGTMGFFSFNCEYDAFFKIVTPAVPQVTFYMGIPNLRPSPDVYNASNFYTIDFKATQTATVFTAGDSYYKDNCGALNFNVYKKKTITDKRILWSTGDTTVTLKVAPTTTTTYYVDVSNGNTVVRDSVRIFVTQEFQANVSIGIKDTTTTENLPIEIPVSTSLLKISDNIISCQFTLSYNQSILQYNSVSLQGTLAEGGSFVVNSNTSGQLHVSYMSTTPLSGTGDLLRLNFKTLAIGKSPLTISNFIYNSSVVSNISNGSITVVDNMPPTASITFSDADGIVKTNDILMITATFNEPVADAPIPQISLSGAANLVNTNMTKVSPTVYTFSYLVAKGYGVVNVSMSAGKDIAGNAITTKPTSGETFTIVPQRHGDIDDNGFVQAYDAAIALQYSVGLDPLLTIDQLPWEAWRIATANVDNIGSITSNDASLILQYSAQLISSFPADLSTKSATVPNADIEISVENGFIIFKPIGELYGLNVFIDAYKEQLGIPQFVDQTTMSVTNISETSYALGLASAYSLTKDKVFMKIPIKSVADTELTFNMVVNTEEKEYTLNLKTHAPRINSDQVSVYPNPASIKLFIDGISKPSTITIADMNGRILICKETEKTNNSIEINSLLRGQYIVEIKNDSGVVAKRFIKQ